jgi:hypothetical protein
VFPLYHVLADVGEFSGGSVIPVVSTSPRVVEGLAVTTGPSQRVLLSNLTADSQRVQLHNLPDQLWIKFLDETNVERAMLAPEAFRAEPGRALDCGDGQLELDLLPYAVVRIDSGIHTRIAPGSRLAQA